MEPQERPLTSDLLRLQLEVVVWRGAIAESRHRVQAAASDPGGRLVAGTPAADLHTTFRSAAKPFQLLPLVERGHADQWEFGDETLAVMAASHTGSAYHLALVTGILARIGLTAADLECGYHTPVDRESADLLLRHPERASALYNNCSGKHAGMLAMCLSEGWPTRGYVRADHPLQQLMRRTVAEACGLAAEDLAVAVDGCSVSVFGLPISAMARGYARFAAAIADGPATGDVRQRALARIGAAMQAYPVATGGEGRFSTTLMTASAAGGTALVAKGGAEGLECVALPSRRLGVVVKSEDGDVRGVGPAVIGVLERLGALGPDTLEALKPWREPVLTNAAGLDVGKIALSMDTPAPVTA